jgi:2-polyprenyl-3-methyl-5-hydroxy-6-metoxy-1,4-benzoquinol methylase
MSKVIEGHNTKSNKLLDGGEGLYAKERSQFIKSVLKKGSKIIDFGSNHNALTKFFVEYYTVTAVDFGEENLKIVKERLGVNTIVYDLNKDISLLGKGKWDVVIMSEVLEHLFFPEKKVPEIAKLIKPNDVFVGTIPNGFSLKNRIRLFFNKPEGATMSEPTHVTHFNYKKIKRILEQNFGFVKITPIRKKQYAFLTHLSSDLFGFDLAFECRNPHVSK